ncbi:MAG: hypothetical protein FNNCIFGK_02063 [Bacteroidia bacterium]|nr:MAG: hypothetical protein UZ10_BCD003000731 [Bacteroidetes bacterium OLB10]MBV6454793.1 hypothetical protein [Bacteroidia bacterium]
MVSKNLQNNFKQILKNLCSVRSFYVLHAIKNTSAHATQSTAV